MKKHIGRILTLLLFPLLFSVSAESVLASTQIGEIDPSDSFLKSLYEQQNERQLMGKYVLSYLEKNDSDSANTWRSDLEKMAQDEADKDNNNEENRKVLKMVRQLKGSTNIELFMEWTNLYSSLYKSHSKKISVDACEKLAQLSGVNILREELEREFEKGQKNSLKDFKKWMSEPCEHHIVIYNCDERKIRNKLKGVNVLDIAILTENYELFRHIILNRDYLGLSDEDFYDVLGYALAKVLDESAGYSASWFDGIVSLINPTDYRSFINSVIAEDAPKALEYLIDNYYSEKNIDWKDSKLMEKAITLESINCIMTLAQHGTDVNKCIPSGRTPLMVAARRGHIECLKLLLENGADPNIGSSSTHITPLMCAVCFGHINCVKLLLEKGATHSINAFDKDYCTALMYAMQKGYTECAKLLLKFGANPNIVNFYRKTDLMYKVRFISPPQ